MPTLTQKLTAATDRRVLLIEDELDIAQIVGRWLHQKGIRTVHAADGRLGLSLCQRDEWDVVVSDIELPDMNGLDLVEASKSLFPSRPVVMVTGHERGEYAIRAIKGGADDYILKPLHREALLRSVERQIHKHDAHRRNVLAIGAHPDDVEIGVGGLLLKHRAAGDRITVLTLTGGEQGGGVSLRHKEAEEAARMMGASLYFGDLPDTAIGEGLDTIGLIRSAIEAARPDVIYTHSLNDAHQDHRAVHRATMVAARGVDNIYCYLSPSTTIDFRPNHFADIGTFLETKLDVISQYRTQTAKAPYLKRELTSATARYWGRFAGYREVEPLEVIREAR